MAATDPADSEHLAALGYRQHLERSVGRFGSFAAGISYISLRQRHRTGVLAEHAAVLPDAGPLPEPAPW